jgi:hypothetical protein
MVIGGYVRPYVDSAIVYAIAPSETYVKAPSEFEVAVDELFNSPLHQKACRGQAEYTVAYDLMHKYGSVAGDSLDKVVFPAPKTMPMTDAVETMSKKK